MATKKSEKKTAKKKSATDRVVELTLENPKATREEIVETLKMDGFDKTAALLVEERQNPGDRRRWRRTTVSALASRNAKSPTLSP